MGEPKASFLATIGQPAGEASRNLKYDPEFCNTVRVLAQEGEFPEAWAATIGVSLETMRQWGHRYPEFREAVIIAKHLLATFWTRDIAANRKNPDAKAPLYAMLARRLPALYGREPVDLTDWLLTPATTDSTGNLAPEALTEDQAKASTTTDLEARLEVLRRRRDEEGTQ